MGTINKRATKWATEQIEENLAELCAVFSQPAPMLIAPDNLYLKHLEHAGIEYDEPLISNISHQWSGTYDIDWGECRIVEVDRLTGVEKKRSRTNAERWEYINATNKASTRQSARDGFEQHVRCAAEVLALDVLRTCSRARDGAHIAEVVESFDQPPVELSYSPPGRGAGWHYQPTGDWEREGTDVLVADLTADRRVFCDRNAVEVCIVPASKDDPLGVRAHIWSTLENPWPQGRICDMVECLDGFRLVLKPRQGGKFVSVKDNRGPLF